MRILGFCFSQWCKVCVTLSVIVVNMSQAEQASDKGE